jgi:hypothetical protein
VDLAERRRRTYRLLLIEGLVIGGGAAVAGVAAGQVTGSAKWGFAAVFLWLAFLIVVWIIVLLVLPDLRKRVFRTYGQAYSRRSRSD